MLRFENVTYTYPFSSAPAVCDLNLQVHAGEVVLVSGQSGCGKSTLMRLANGLCPGYFKGNLEGRILIAGKNSTDIPLKDMSRTVGTLFQDPEQQFFALGVEDELAFVHEWRGTPAKTTQKKIHDAADAFGLKHILNHSIHELSEGQKQKVGLASILSQNPRILVLDEPTANLDPESTADLAQRLQLLKKQGMAILVVDHRLYWLEGVADRVLVMKQGEICAMGGYTLLEDENLRQSCGLRDHHGEDVRHTLPDISLDCADMQNQSLQANNTPHHGLCVKDLTFGYKGQPNIFSHASFCLNAGITALIGKNGSGKTTLARLMTGLSKAQSGTFFIDGKEIPTSEMLRHTGIVLQNADHQLHMKTVHQELEVCLALADRLNGKKSLPAQGYAKAVHDLLELFGLSQLKERHPQSLSGGEKQRLVIACAFAKKPHVLILDEPTSGLDGKNMQRIAHALQILAEQGACILVITHDLELMKRSCTQALRLPLADATYTGANQAPQSNPKEI